MNPSALLSAYNIDFFRCARWTKHDKAEKTADARWQGAAGWGFMEARWFCVRGTGHDETISLTMSYGMHDRIHSHYHVS